MILDKVEKNVLKGNLNALDPDTLEKMKQFTEKWNRSYEP
jgi:hypothetical protein